MERTTDFESGEWAFETLKRERSSELIYRLYHKCKEDKWVIVKRERGEYRCRMCKKKMPMGFVMAAKTASLTGVLN